MERVLVSLLAAFTQFSPAGRGRRWRDVQRVGTGEGREKSEWGKKDCGMKSVERGKMRSSEGKGGADKSSKRK